MSRSDILAFLNQILQRQGKPAVSDESVALRDAGLRSLDFSELALRVETAAGQPLVFDAGPLRAIHTVRDALDFLEQASRGVAATR